MGFLISACLLILSSHSMCFSYLLRVFRQPYQHVNIRNKNYCPAFCGYQSYHNNVTEKQTLKNIPCFNTPM